MRFSVIVCTKNRASALPGCLDSIKQSISYAPPVTAEIVVVDNGSNDNTAEVIRTWAKSCPFPVRALHEPRPGQTAAYNCAVAGSQGELLAFTDDDCRLSPDYVADLLRYDAGDTELVVRGGRIELGDPTDLPLTIKTSTQRVRWDRRNNAARHACLSGQISGCNMTMRRRVVEQVGPFDDRFGPGAPIISSGADTEFLFRAYVAGIALEYVPDMTVYHHHGRKDATVGHKLVRNYMIANGALAAKFLFTEPNFARPFYWDLKNAIKEALHGNNTFVPEANFSHRDKLWCGAIGALRWWFRSRGIRNAWTEDVGVAGAARTSPLVETLHLK